jgi:hypothetical protein
MITSVGPRQMETSHDGVQMRVRERRAPSKAASADASPFVD